ncbi:hypothetical protein BJV78DRAFT_1283069 [Lactifluus subvellereus]|nr:hypothetical protein BJV78DRAFT_1283069 [Lactifluus subvellereus]
MHDTLLRGEIEEFYQYLQKILRADQLTIPSNNYDLVLDITPTENGRIQWSYYYACHDNRCLFWLEIYDASYMVSEVNGVSSPAHVKHLLEASYWNHWSLFPAVFEGRRLPISVYDELVGILSYGCIDVMTSAANTTTLPYDDDEMRKMIELVRQARVEGNSGVEHHTAGTARLLSFFAHWRFLYFHGQKYAQLLDQTADDKAKPKRTLLIKLLSPLLFFAPEIRLRDTMRRLIDGRAEKLKKIPMTNLSTGWKDVILWSTVMLAANVGFLAIPGVVLSNLSETNITSPSQMIIFTSPAQIASFLSMEASLGSILVGLLLVRHNRTRQEEDLALAGGASAYLHQSYKLFGSEPMTVVFSLPWALLMWSYVVLRPQDFLPHIYRISHASVVDRMVLFFIALLLLCFTISNTSTRIFVSVTSVMMAPPVVGCILISAIKQ